MALFISHDDTQQLITMGDAIDCAERALVSEAEGRGFSAERQRMEVPGGVYRSMSGVYPDEHVFGTKAGLQKFSFPPGVVKAPVQALFSSETGDLLCVLWSDLLTQVRTAAMGGVSIRHLAPRVPDRIGLIGTGRQARHQLLAALSERPGIATTVYSRDPDRRAAFADVMSGETGTEVTAVASAHEAVAGAQIVIAATSASSPVFDGTSLGSGCHVVSIRSSYSHDVGLGHERREIDDVTVARSDVVVVDSIEQAVVQDSPEIVPVVDRAVTLGQVAAGMVPGRTDADQITLFKSFGSGLVDVAVAAFVYRRAFAAGLGTELERPRNP